MADKASSQDNGSSVAHFPSPIQPRHSRLLECSVKVNPKYDKLPADRVAILDAFPIKFTSKFQTVEKPEKLFKGSLLIELHQGPGYEPPYFFRIEIEGLFQPTADLSNPKLENSLATAYGTASLMGTARELLALITARSIHGPVLLPSILFGPKPSDKRPAPTKKRIAAKKGR